MLLTFTIANYRSFSSEQAINLIASKRLGPNANTPHCHAVPGMDEHALRVASLYGANAAGKSNLVRALGLLQRLVLKGTSSGKPIEYDPFRLDPVRSVEPTTFELQFLEEDEVFHYGVCYDSQRVHEEWLDVHEGTKERSVFARATDEAQTVTVELGPGAEGDYDSTKMKALAQVGARPNQLFLTEAANLDAPSWQGPRFRKALHWFQTVLSVRMPGAEVPGLADLLDADPKFLGFAQEFLRSVDSGISSLRVERVEPDLKSITGALLMLFSELAGKGGSKTPTDDQIVLRQLQSEHQARDGKSVVFPLEEESDGSRRLIHLLPALFGISKRKGVLVIDELERSMHPMLAWKCVEFFLKSAPSTESQLIFTTHESSLLDLNLQRRDGICFAEKNESGATHIYSLADFKVRNDLRIERGYLQGRFGAVPFLGGLDAIMESQAASESQG